LAWEHSVLEVFPLNATRIGECDHDDIAAEWLLWILAVGFFDYD
jgi:hypothetical protein